MYCKRQSQDAEYVCGLPTVKTCYVFAIINAIVTSLAVLGVLACLGLLFYLTVRYGEDWHDFGLIIPTLVGAGSYLASAITEIFACLLLVGIRKKIPKLVKAYLFYGITVEIMLIGALVVATAIYFREIFRFEGSAICAGIALCICVLYGFVLRLVMNTYIVLRNSRLRANPTDVQALFMLGPDSALQLVPLVR